MSRYIGIMYKIKRYLPLQARLQVFHSLVQSHLNYCSLVWGFSSKSNIKAIFSKQKKGIRAVVPGFINYRYKEGILPGHTKSYFNEYRILTIHGIIGANALTFIHKVRHFPNSLPVPLCKCIPNNSPVPGSDHETAEAWLNVYDNMHYRTSLFFKGPMLSTMQELLNIAPASYHKIKIYKSEIKSVLLRYQAEGEVDEWLSSNIILDNIPGLRKSTRLASA